MRAMLCPKIVHAMPPLYHQTPWPGEARRQKALDQRRMLCLAEEGCRPGSKPARTSPCTWMGPSSSCAMIGLSLVDSTQRHEFVGEDGSTYTKAILGQQNRVAELLRVVTGTGERRHVIGTVSDEENGKACVLLERSFSV